MLTGELPIGRFVAPSKRVAIDVRLDEVVLRTLFRGQVLQMLIGIVLIAIGARCWAPNLHVPQLAVSGVIVHIYGLVMIISAAVVCSRIKGIDYSKPIDQIRAKLGSLQSAYLFFGPIIGFAWWLIWIPICVAIGFEAVLHPNCLYVSVIVGVAGLLASQFLYLKVLKTGEGTAEKWRMRLSGKSIAFADHELDQIEIAKIR